MGVFFLMFSAFVANIWNCLLNSKHEIVSVCTVYKNVIDLNLSQNLVIRWFFFIFKYIAVVIYVFATEDLWDISPHHCSQVLLFCFFCPRVIAETEITMLVFLFVTHLYCFTIKGRQEYWELELGKAYEEYIEFENKSFIWIIFRELGLIDRKLFFFFFISLYRPNKHYRFQHSTFEKWHQYNTYWSIYELFLLDVFENVPSMYLGEVREIGWISTLNLDWETNERK